VFPETTKLAIIIAIGGFTLLFLQTLFYMVTNVNGAQSYNGDPTGIRWFTFFLFVFIPFLCVLILNYLMKNHIEKAHLKLVHIFMMGLNAVMILGVLRSLSVV